jgi:Protoglobin
MTTEEQTDFATFFDRIRSFVGWTDGDAELVAQAWPRVEPAVSAAIDDFYNNIRKHTFTDSILTGGDRQVERLKRTLVQWLHSLFSGKYDLEFAWSRWRVGRRHVEIGLNQSYALGALARLRLHINRAIQQPIAGFSECPAECFLAVNKLLDIDAAIIQFAYQESGRGGGRKTAAHGTVGFNRPDGNGPGSRESQRAAAQRCVPGGSAAGNRRPPRSPATGNPHSDCAGPFERAV